MNDFKFKIGNFFGRKLPILEALKVVPFSKCSGEFGLAQTVSSIIKNWVIVKCNSRNLIGLVAMVYDPLYHALQMW